MNICHVPDKDLIFVLYIIITLTAGIISFTLLLWKRNFLQKKIEKREVDTKLWHRLIFIIITIYAIVFSFLSILKYNAYNMGIPDLASIDQAIWNTSQGRILNYTCFSDFSEVKNVCRLGYQVEPIFIPISLFYLIYSDPRTLLVLQTLAIALGALPLFWLTKEKLKSSFAGLCFAIGYLLYPTLQYANLFDFHGDTLSPPFLLFTFYYLQKKDYMKFFIFLFLALMCKQYISLIIFMLGLYIIFKQRDIKLGIITSIIGIAWFSLSMWLIIPFFSGKESVLFAWRYQQLGGSAGLKGLVRTIILHPLDVFRSMFVYKKMAYLLLIFLPVGFLSFLGSPTLLISLPIFIINLLADVQHSMLTTADIRNHHSTTIAPFIFISSVYGAVFLINCLKKISNQKSELKEHNLIYAISSFVFACSLFSNFFFSPSPLSWKFWKKSEWNYYGNLHNFKVTQHDRITDKFIEMIPPDAVIMANDKLLSHLSQRQTFYIFPAYIDKKLEKKVDYIFTDILEYQPYDRNDRRIRNEILARIFREGKFGLKAIDDGLVLFENGLKQEEGYYLNVTIANYVQPQYILNREFDKRLLLIGYDFIPQILEPGKKYRIVYYWKVLGNFDKPYDVKYFKIIEKLNNNYIVVDKIKNKDNELRIVHLPIYLLYPPDKWQTGQTIREEYDFLIPDYLNQGSYDWEVGIYNVPYIFPVQTRAVDIVPDTIPIKLGKINIVYKGE